jgi:Asp-tRNA(Asn)/Glu-tRNA(Gln) amidotransferase A subunit family amidase
LTIRSSVVRNHVKKRLLRATNVSFSDGEEAATQKRKFDENEVFELATASFDIAVTPVLASTAWPRGAQNDFVLAAIAQNLRRLATLVARPPPALVLHNA